MTYITCKRCSVVRVNLLCDLYEKGCEGNDGKALEDLTSLVRLARERGFEGGQVLLSPGLGRSVSRPVCWNVSSLLTDEDLERLGYKTK
jgi:hypothetical protein